MSTQDATFSRQPVPTHHVHHSSDVLPGARGGTPPADYSTDVTNDPRTWQDNNQRRFGAGTDTSAVMAGGQHNTPEAGAHQTAPVHSAFNEDRPMDVQPTSQGGVAIGGNNNLPEGKASMTDKLIGKGQKVAGKVMRNPDLHEKGELRESGGKDAAAGQAQAPHD
ncbi:hypothetical protein A0H81_05193 [Grifola frondosa]|uniref:CsbD-like domain-containing protein n=1 Tax=Grifola frondosa TaxID=5627 RepID=A0A1C7MC89_GRIFR|nr:hypothetical protein A0H81_05193 [Grifola frondosa]